MNLMKLIIRVLNLSKYVTISHVIHVLNCSISLDILEPYISLPYNKIGLISVSNSSKITLTGRLNVCVA